MAAPTSSKLNPDRGDEVKTAGPIHNPNQINLGSWFFYEDAPAVVQEASYNIRPPCNSFRMPKCISDEISDTGSVEHALDEVRYGQPDPVNGRAEWLEKSLLPSELWMLEKKVLAWKDLSTVSSSFPLVKAVLNLKNIDKNKVTDWLLINSPSYGIVLDSTLAQQVFVLLRLLFHVAHKEALNSIKSDLQKHVTECTSPAHLTRKSESIHIFFHECLSWLLCILCILYHPPQARALVLELVKFCVILSAQALCYTSGKIHRSNQEDSNLEKRTNDIICAENVELAASALQDLNIDSYTAEPSCKELIEEPDELKHLNVVFIGHVDAGKSTIGGQILFISNMVDERTIQKYEREAKEKNRESWYMAYIMDTNEEERAKGKTVEVGRAHFETLKSRFTILDAPGHKNYVPNMISGASQADVGVLVIAARKGEFETGFERGGQTREHAQLAKTLGVSKLLVVVNKMDDPSVQWSKERFDEIEKKMVPFLKSCGYNVKKDVQFLPISGLYGHNMKERISKDICPWWDGPCLFEALDAVEIPERNPTGPFRMPLIDKYKDMGTVVMGKIESGSVRRGDSLIVMPNKAPVKVVTIFRDTREVNYAKPGENLRIRLSGVEEEDISPGFVLSGLRNPISAVLEFDAQLQILELLDHKAIFTAGYKAILHIHAVVEECEIMQLLQQIDPKTKKPIKKRVLFVKTGAVVVARIQVTQQICVEKFEDFPQLGRFTLRDEGKTVAIGKVVKLPKVAAIQE